MLYAHTNAALCQREAERMGRILRHRAYTLALSEVEIIGPAPAFPERVKGRYRWHLILRGPDLHPLLEGLAIPQDWTVDFDPVSVL
jgi:primosomal protein N' (replication factor Y)